MTVSRGYSYIVLVPNANLPIDLDDLKRHLRIPLTDTSQDAELTLTIKAVAKFAETYTKRTLLETLFRTYRDFFWSLIELRRSKFISLDAFEYSVEDTFQAVDSDLYYLTEENDFSRIALRSDKSYPTDIDDKLDSVRIDFRAGYGADYTSIPEDLYMAMLNHAALVFENRGDCDDDVNQKSNLDIINRALPSLSRAVYNFYRIIDDTGDGYL